jgi:hypothetical protein
MSSQRRSKTITGNSFSTSAIGLVILFVPIASIWYLLRNSSDLFENDREPNDRSEDDEDLAYGSDSGANNGHDADDRGPVHPGVSINPSSVTGSPANPPSTEPKAKKSKQSELDELNFVAAGAAGLSGAGFDSHGSVYIPSQPGSQNGDRPGTELVNAGTMQVKGIRSVRGDLEDYMSRD